MHFRGKCSTKNSIHLVFVQVDNNNLDTNYEDRYSTPLPDVGQGVYTMLEANRLEDTSATWVPGTLFGIKLNPNPITTTLFTIKANNNTETFTDPWTPVKTFVCFHSRPEKEGFAQLRVLYYNCLLRKF